VAVVEEGVELRRAGVEAEILVMGWIGSGQLPDLVRFSLTGNLHSFENLAALGEFARARGAVLPVHLKLDTGMTRLGFRPGETGMLADRLLAEPGLRVEGVFQNFASADEVGGAQTGVQIRTFGSVVRELEGRGIPAGILHVANSAGTLLPPVWPEGLRGPGRVRPGLALFTRFPGLPGDDLEDVMSFRSVVDQVKTVPAGTRVGYGGAFVTERETTLAIVPAGYADGVPRSLSGAGAVLIGGVRCPVAGRIAMDLTGVDATELGRRPAHGEEVLFFGTQLGVRLGIEEFAASAGTVPWEVLCGVGPRVPRVIVDNGAPERVVSRFLPDGDQTSYAFS
jgi:alanine racemase